MAILFCGCQNEKKHNNLNNMTSQTKYIVDSPGYNAFFGIDHDTLLIKYEPKPLKDSHPKTGN